MARSYSNRLPAGARVLILAVAGIGLVACQTNAGLDLSQTAEFRMDRYEEMQRIQGFDDCSNEGLTLDTEARSRASSGAFLNSARVLQHCIEDVSPSADVVPENQRMRVHALSIVNYFKGGDVKAARQGLNSFKLNYPNRDLYFGNSTSFIETAEVLLGRIGDFQLGQFAALNVDAELKREVRRINYWKNK